LGEVLPLDTDCERDNNKLSGLEIVRGRGICVWWTPSNRLNRADSRCHHLSRKRQFLQLASAWRSLLDPGDVGGTDHRTTEVDRDNFVVREYSKGR
jgi:hypothetical protein